MEQYLDIAKEYYDKAVKAVTKTETEKKLAHALSRENWGASTTELREIARLTHDWQEYGVVMREVWATLQLTANRWRQVFKALTLLEYLIKNGAERVVDESRDKIYQIKALTAFSYYHDGIEKGAGIREKAKQVLELLGDNERIREECQKAMALRDKYTGIGRDGTRGSLYGEGGSSYDPANSSGRYSDAQGRYRDDFDTDKRWDEANFGIGSKKQFEDDNAHDDEDFNPRGSERDKKPEQHEFSFAQEDELEEDTQATSGKDRKGKTKLKIKIRSAQPEKLTGDEIGEDLLFGAEKTKENENVDLFGDALDKRSGKAETFDPFSNESNNKEDDNEEEWAAFESGAPGRKSDNTTDEFDLLGGAPVSTSNQYNSFQTSMSESTQGTMSQNLGLNSLQNPSMNLSGTPVGMQRSNQTPQINQPIISSSNPSNQPGPSKSALGEDTLWSSGLVDLGNLSLNNESKSAGSQSQGGHPSKSAQPSGNLGIGGMSMNHMQSMPADQSLPAPQNYPHQIRQQNVAQPTRTSLSIQQPNLVSLHQSQAKPMSNPQNSQPRQHQDPLDGLF